MKKNYRRGQSKKAKSHSSDLAEFIKNHQMDNDFKIYDWLRTLDTCDLRCIEEEAQNCCYGNIAESVSLTPGPDMLDLAVIAYEAETYREICKDGRRDCLENLLVGLSV